MVDWFSPEVIALHADVFKFLLLVLLGVYGWECVGGLASDYRLITNATLSKLDWPTAVYFLCKYSTLFSVIGLNVTNLTPTQLPCQGMYTMNQFLGNSGIGAASFLLAYRVIAMSSRSGLWSNGISWGLYLLLCGQWAILAYGVISVKSDWNEAAGRCIVTDTTPHLLSVIYFYTMALDMIVLVLSLLLLSWFGESGRRNKLWCLLLKQGVFYFFVAFAGNSVAAVFVMLKLNRVMGILLAVPACVFSAIVACRSFISLKTFTAREQSTLHIDIASPIQGPHGALSSNFHSDRQGTFSLSKQNVAVTLPPLSHHQTTRTRSRGEQGRIVVVRSRRIEHSFDSEDYFSSPVEEYSTVVFALPGGAESTIQFASPDASSSTESLGVIQDHRNQKAGLLGRTGKQ